MPSINGTSKRAKITKPAQAAGFVLVVVAIAIVLALIVYSLNPDVREGSIKAVLLLGVLALMAEAWQFMLPQSAAASIAFIPYAAMALVAPDWVVVAAVAAAKLLEAWFSRRSPLKSVFNIAL